jgi:hypothetical protein
MNVDRTTDTCAEVASLVSLAARNAMPGFQYMDAATIAWIASHCDEFPAISSTPETRVGAIGQRILETGPIPSDWHAEPNLVNSLHGTRHLLRTAALAALLAELYGLGSRDTATLVVAASMHDCRRLHDNNDTGHGERASTWLIEHSSEVFSFFGVHANATQIHKAAVAIRLHDVPYIAFTESDAASRVATEGITDLLKAADALDRYRLPTLEWWPRYEYLRVVPPMWLRRVAFDLVLETESACLAGADSVSAVLTALRRRKLLP